MSGRACDLDGDERDERGKYGHERRESDCPLHLSPSVAVVYAAVEPSGRGCRRGRRAGDAAASIRKPVEEVTNREAGLRRTTVRPLP